MYVKMTEQVESHVADFPIPLDEEVGDPLAYPSNVKNCIVGIQELPYGSLGS